MLSRILFFRDFQSCTGGHGKVWDYFCHCLGSERWVDAWSVRDFDALFIAGMDWMELNGLDLPPDLPVIILIQGIRHADPQLPLRRHLHRRAIRICVSQPVADAILATGGVNGPVRVIPAGLDMPSLPARLP
jgi:hypothetical protein